LRDFRLVRGIGSVPLGVLKHIAQDDDWKDARVIALSVVVSVDFVEGSQVAHVRKHLVV
jgi:hypothetical protein